MPMATRRVAYAILLNRQKQKIEPGRVLWLNRCKLRVTTDLHVEIGLSTGGMEL